MIKSGRSKSIFLALALILCGSCQTGARDLAPGQRISNLQLTDLESQNKTDLYRLAEGKQTILAFMASWCESCKAELPELIELQSRLLAQNKGQIVAIAMDDTIANLRQFKTEFKLNFPILLDADGKSRRFYRITGFPEFIVLDSKMQPIAFSKADGSLAVKLVGPQDWNNLDLF